MKVLLINPPRENEIIGNNPAIIEQERGHNPPLGLLYIASCLEKHSDHNVKIIDSQVEQLSYSDLKAAVRAYHPDVVGLTAMTMTLIDVYKTVNLVKEVDSSIRIVVGGPHVYLFPRETMANRKVDYLVLGEGEETFHKLLSAIDDFKRLEQIPGVVFRKDEQVVIPQAPQQIGDLNAIPFPARHLVPYKKYSSVLMKRNPVTTMITSRGCPFKCSFCDRPHLGKKFRACSAEYVVSEFEECIRMGIHEFLIYDDTFTINKKRVLDICREVVKRKLDIGFDIRARVDTISEDMLRWLKRAGCEGIHYGVEAGTEKILRVLNKGITSELVQDVFKITRKVGIPILAYFMIGSPSETKEDIKKTFHFIKKLNLDYVHITILTPFPGTKIYLDGLKSGIIKEDYWRRFAEVPKPDFVPPHWEEFFTRDQLNEILVDGYRKFYLRPSYILRRILKVRSLGEFKDKAHAGLKVLKMK
jgi:radical SAM superfamily enzyme YgiQ (UPF0313 family)